MDRKIHDSIFRAYDIRGIYGTDLTDDDAELLGMAFGTYVRRRGGSKAIVGRDNRVSSPELARSVINGLRASGVSVVSIGMVTTPIFYYSTIDFRIGAGIMVTASHNPVQYNGFKVQYGGRTLCGPELREIMELMKQGGFEHGAGEYDSRSPLFLS